MRPRILLILLLAACIARLWLMPLPSSFWVDEMVSAFVIHYGAGHPSLAVAPQVTATIYYWLPRASEALFGFSEITYRIPSLLALGAALWLIGRLAARLIHPDAAWFAVFACLGLRGFNYEAADARPYAFGTFIAAAALWFLVRWLDTARWRDGLLFVLFAALLWRVHLVFWPFYVVFSLYLLVRLVRRETKVTWLNAGAILGLVALALAPVLLDALNLFHEAKSHVIVDLPKLRDLRRTLKFLLIALCGGGALVLSRFLHWKREGPGPSLSSWVLVAGWWLWHPVALFAFSKLTGNSVYVDRYLSLALPGAGLMATLAAAYFIPDRQWKPLAAVVAVGVFLAMGQWRQIWPPHHNSDWRDAARSIDQWALGGDTPVICPSPFIEAKFPVWNPDYALPGFLYSYLPVYKISGRPYLLPFESSPEAETYAAQLAQGPLSTAPRFLIYGGDRNVWRWRKWFEARPELHGWSSRLLGPFGDVEVALFENPATAAKAN
jgi:hypothetical protein